MSRNVALDDREGETDASKTLIESAYATLRREILDGALEPGAKLRTEQLRTRYNVSGSTMREALTRLLGEALVTTEGQRGFRVAPASLSDFKDLTEVRQLLETEALKLAIENGDEAWESQIVASFYRLSKVEEQLARNPTGDLGEFEARNREFHNALIAACPSRWLHHIIGLLFQHSERYRRLSIARRKIPRDVHAEHQAIFDATLARDTDRACAMLREHIDKTLVVLRSALEQQELTGAKKCATVKSAEAAPEVKRKRGAPKN